MIPHPTLRAHCFHCARPDFRYDLVVVHLHEVVSIHKAGRAAQRGGVVNHPCAIYKSGACTLFVAKTILHFRVLESPP